jgi:glutathione peroxidase
LQQDLARVQEAGINVAGISYDSVDTLSGFAKKANIEYTLFSDPDSQVIRQFGLQNDSAKQGKKAGISYPMTVLINTDGTVAATLPGEVRTRHTSDQLIESSSKIKSASPANAEINSVLDFKVKNIAGEEVSLSDYSGKVMVIVNVASKCGMTPQYEKLQSLYDEHKDSGLVVLGFPCNQFGGQEPGTNEEIQEFCEKNYGVTFDMFDKIEVNGENQAPLYKFLESHATEPTGAGDVKWNFEKFVVGRNGNVAARYGTRTAPDDEAFLEALTKLLSEPAGEAENSKAAADK